MKTAYLSLGSNLGDRQANLDAALALLTQNRIHVKRASSTYETEPMELRDQPWFLNLVAEVETALLPKMLLGRLQRIERALGRRRLTPKGPRTIDIDILLYGSFVLDTPELEIPHPRMHTRRFVLEPMVELVPELRHPVLRKTMSELCAQVRGQTVRRRGVLLQPAKPAVE